MAAALRSIANGANIDYNGSRKDRCEDLSMRSDDFAHQREQMVDHQIRGRGVTDPFVLGAMKKIPRERFVPVAEQQRSYHDGPLGIGFEQTISQPFIVAYMTEKLELGGSERILELGTGSGYQTAVLAEISAWVYTVEVVPELARRAMRLLQQEMGYENIEFRVGNGREGWVANAPYDRILLTAAPEEVPRPILDQLGEGGVAVAPVGRYHQQLIQYRKTEGRVVETPLIGVSFVPFI